MKQAEEVSYYNNSAKIYSAQDGYHATWYFNGKRIKRQFKTLKLAKEAALQALRQIHHGEGQLAQLSPAQKSALIHTQKLLQDHGITDPEMAMREYVSAKKIADGIDLTTVATYWANTRTTLETVSFQTAANDWIETKRPKWSKAHADKVITRTARLCKLFTVDLLDADYESVRTFFNVDLRDNQPRYRNNFREIFRSIFKNAVERKWLPKEHGFTELLRNEPTVDKAKTSEELKADELVSEAAETRDIEVIKQILASTEGKWILKAIGKEQGQEFNDAGTVINKWNESKSVLLMESKINRGERIIEIVDIIKIDKGRILMDRGSHQLIGKWNSNEKTIVWNNKSGDFVFTGTSDYSEKQNIKEVFSIYRDGTQVFSVTADLKAAGK